MSDIALMSKRIRIGWVCNSGLLVSETFISDNLILLQSMAEVSAWCGRQPTDQRHSQIEYLNFDDVPQRWHHIVRGKLSGRNLVMEEKQARALSLLRPRINEFHPDYLWVEFGTTAEVIAPLLQEAHVPYILNVHGYDVSKEFNQPKYKSLFVQLANSSHAVVCASHHTKNLCIAAGVQASRCHVIRYALNGNSIQRNPAVAKTEYPSFVHFGRLTPKKNPLVTLEAFRIALNEMPTAKLSFIGSGPLEDELLQRIQRHEITHAVRLYPAMERNEAIKIVQAHWVFCQHSVTAANGDQEGFGLSPAEAALLNMPVISTTHNGIPEHVADGKTGLLTREWDIEAMAKAMVQLAENPSLRNTMGTNGRKNILTLCSSQKRTNAIRKLLNC